jgi:hypothetical protein
MSMYILFGILILVILMFWLNKRVQKEKVEGFGIFRDLTNEFTSVQRSYFHDQANKEILVNPNVNLSGVTNAFKQGDMYLPTSPDRDFGVYFREDDNSFTKRDYELCRGVQHPKNLKRPPKATIGCSWWFVEDPGRRSTGALGTTRGPLDPNLGRDYPGGRWVWSLSEAMKLEDIKRCKGVKTCEAINADGIFGDCAYCPELGHAIPVDSSGKPKYPDSDEVCGEALIQNADSCPKASAMLEESGVVIETEGVADPRTGETIQLLSVPVKNLCDPDDRGFLTKDCLVSLATSVGMSPAGVVIKRLKGELFDHGLYNAAKDFVRGGAGIIVNESPMDRDTASSLYSRIVQAMNNSSHKVREAAKFLAIGNANFDICYNEDNEVGPFAADCLQREFRKAGCQLSGKAAPSETNKSILDGMTWKDVKNSYAKLFQQTRSKDSKIQDKAVQDCIGTMFHRPKADVCDEQGIEYRVYTSNYFYVGRYISKDGLVPESPLQFATNEANPVLDLARKAGPNAHIRMITCVSVRSPSSLDLQGIVQKGRYTVTVETVDSNKRKLTQEITPYQRIPHVSDIRLEGAMFSIPLQPKVRTKIDILYRMPKAIGLLSKSEFIKNNLPMFQLEKPSWAPFTAYDFFKGSKFGLHGNEQIVTMGGKRCLSLNQTPVTLPGIQSDKIQSIAWMSMLSELGGWPTAFAYNFVAGTGEFPVKLHFGAAFGKDVEELQMGIYLNNGQIYGKYQVAGASPVGKWTHYAIVIHGDRTGFDMYINGKKVHTVRGAPIQDVRMLNNGMLGGNGFKGGVAWFHVYDYPLTPQEVLRDMNSENPDYIMPEPEVPNIPIRTYLLRNFEGDDYGGGDYNSLRFTDNNQVKNLQECQDACGEADQCVAYTFNPHTKTCWLKDRFRQRNRLGLEGVHTGRISKFYSIENDWDGNSKCLDVFAYNTHNGGKVVTWNCNGSTNQQFAYDDKERFIAKHSGKCLEISQGRMDSNTPIVQNECNDSDHQKFTIDWLGRIHPKHKPDFCLDLWDTQREAQGGTVVQGQCHEGKNQRWIVRDAAKATNKVTFYQHCNYSGREYTFGPGTYVHGKDFPNDDLSSVRIPPGRTVVVYKHGNGAGDIHAIFNNSVPCFVGRQFSDGTDINDQISHILVE